MKPTNVTSPSVFDQGMSGGIEVLERKAAEERAQIAARQVTTEQPVQDDHMIEVASTRKWLERMLKMAERRYNRASPLLKNELCIPREAIEGTLERVVRAFYRG